MRLEDFLAQLPPQVMDHFRAFELDKAVAALSDDLFAELSKAVIARLQAAEDKNPNAEEIALWGQGERGRACQLLRARTGQALGVCHALLKRGLLTNLTAHVFHDEPQDPPT
jgi:hypothetical protein